MKRNTSHNKRNKIINSLIDTLGAFTLILSVIWLISAVAISYYKYPLITGTLTAGHTILFIWNYKMRSRAEELGGKNLSE